jgi:alpha-ketoglutarate-dependent taurine dioxygenase
MNYRIHDNGWTVIIDNFDLRSASQENIDQISKLLYSNTVVVIKKQTLSIEDELRFVNMFSNPSVIGYPSIEVAGSNGLILRVGGWADEHGVQGIAEQEEEMAWHHDFQWQLVDKPSLILLHAIFGAEGSKTSWINNLLSYEDLDQTTKELLRTLNAVMLNDTDFNVAKFYEDSDSTRWPHGKIIDGYNPEIVRNGRLYFPFNQIYNFVGMTREESKQIIVPMMKHLTQPKYIYTHEWDDGDVVISDQWTSLHMRWPCKNTNNRLLHRATFDYTIKE